MSYSRITYTGTGHSIYSVPFNFITVSDLYVYVNGVLKTIDVDYTLNDHVVTFVDGKWPALNSTVLIKRITSRTEEGRHVVFTDGSDITGKALNTASLQLLFIIQEVLDDVASGVGVGTSDSGGGSSSGGSSSSGGTSGGINWDTLDGLIDTINDTVAANYNANVSALLNEAATRASALLDEAAARRAAILEAHDALVDELLKEVDDRKTAILEAKTQLQTADANLAQRLSVVEASYSSGGSGGSGGDATAIVSAEATARASADSALAQQINSVKATADSASSRVATIEQAIASGSDNTALASRITSLETTVGNNTSAISAEQTARSNGDSTLASQLSSLNSSVGNIGSRLTTVESTLSSSGGGSSNEALAYRVTTLETNVGSNTSSITAEQTARANADSAINATLTSLTTTVNNNTAAISTESSSRVTADNAITSRLDTLTTNYNNLSSSITSEANTRATADSTISTTVTNLSSTVSSHTTSLSTVSAAITSEAQTRASADSSISTTVSNLSSTVSGLSSSITTEAQTRATADGNLSGQYVLKVDANGNVAGMKITSTSGTGGTTSEVAFTAAAFKVWNGSATECPFYVTGGVVYINSAYIASLSADKLTAGTISASVALASPKISTVGAVYNTASPANTMPSSGFSSATADNGGSGYTSLGTSGTEIWMITYDGWARGSGYSTTRFGKSSTSFMCFLNGSCNVSSVSGASIEFEIIYRVNSGSTQQVNPFVYSQNSNGTGSVSLSAGCTIDGLTGTDYVQFGVRAKSSNSSVKLYVASLQVAALNF